MIKRVDSFNYIDEKLLEGEKKNNNINSNLKEVNSTDTPSKLITDLRLPKLDLSSWSQKSSNSLHLGSMTKFETDSVEIRPKHHTTEGETPVLQVTNSMSLMERR